MRSSKEFITAEEAEGEEFVELQVSHSDLSQTVM
jgi:hypothetical protein